MSKQKRLEISKLKRVLMVLRKRKEAGRKRATMGRRVSIHYIGSLSDKTIFDSTVEGAPFTFRLGVGLVIPALESGIEGMCVGETRRIRIPPELAYGAQGVAYKIPPMSRLTFDVDMVKIE